MMTPPDRPRFDRGAVHQRALEPRTAAELLPEMAQSIGGTLCILDHVAQHERLAPGIVHAAGGDRLSSRPMHLAERAA